MGLKLETNNFKHGTGDSAYKNRQGCNYLSGSSKSLSVPDAIKCFLDAMDQGDDYARFNYALLVHNGLTEYLPDNANTIIEPLVNRGLIDANYFKENSNGTGDIVEVNDDKIIVTPESPTNSGSTPNGLVVSDIFRKDKYEYWLGMDEGDRSAFGGWFRRLMLNVLKTMLGDRYNNYVDVYTLPISDAAKSEIEPGTFQKVGKMKEYFIICYLYSLGDDGDIYTTYDKRSYSHKDFIGKLHKIRIFSNKCLHNTDPRYKFPTAKEVSAWYDFLQSILKMY